MRRAASAVRSLLRPAPVARSALTASARAWAAFSISRPRAESSASWGRIFDATASISASRAFMSASCRRARSSICRPRASSRSSASAFDAAASSLRRGGRLRAPAFAAGLGGAGRGLGRGLGRLWRRGRRRGVGLRRGRGRRRHRAAGHDRRHESGGQHDEGGGGEQGATGTLDGAGGVHESLHAMAEAAADAERARGRHGKKGALAERPGRDVHERAGEAEGTGRGRDREVVAEALGEVRKAAARPGVERLDRRQRLDEAGQQDPGGVAAREVGELVGAQGHLLVRAEPAQGARGQADLGAQHARRERDRQPRRLAEDGAAQAERVRGHERPRCELARPKRPAAAQHAPQPGGGHEEPGQRDDREGGPGGREPRSPARVDGRDRGRGPRRKARRHDRPAPPD